MEQIKKENYLVHDHTKRGKVFSTLDEANSYCMMIMRKNREVYCIEKTKRKVTHTFDI